MSAPSENLPMPVARPKPMLLRHSPYFIGAAIVVVLGLVVLAWWTHRKPPAVTTDATPNVTVIIPGRHAVTTQIPAVGNIGAIRDVTVTAPESSGAIGIALTRKWPGPALLQRIEVRGFSV